MDITNQMSSLEELHFFDVTKSKICFPNEPLNITKLNVTDCKLDNFNRLDNLANLKELKLGSINDGLKDFSFLKPMRKLEKLNISTTDISDFSSFPVLETLKEFRLTGGFTGSDVKDVEFLKDYRNLRVVDLSNNILIYLDGLQNLKELEELNLSNNRTFDISSLANLKNLKILNLNDNRVHDLSPLSELNKLETLELFGNQVTDISPLLNLENLGKANLSANKIEDKKQEAIINRLISRGVNVMY